MTTLTPSQIQRLVAETLGWRPCPKAGCMQHWTNPSDGREYPAPNFRESLDACLAFEKDAPEEYWIHLISLCAGLSYNYVDTSEGIHSFNFSEIVAVARATPLQRCESFLRWKGAIL